EIESVLSRQPGVKDAVVVAREEAGEAKRLVAYGVRGEGLEGREGGLKEAVGKELPGDMVPAGVVLLVKVAVWPDGEGEGGRWTGRGCRGRREESRGTRGRGRRSRRRCVRSGGRFWGASGWGSTTISSRSADTRSSPPASSPPSARPTRSISRCARSSRTRR